MRISLALFVAAMTSPALAQFPPPGIYACADEAGVALGTISLLVAGDYQWQWRIDHGPDGVGGDECRGADGAAGRAALAR